MLLEKGHQQVDDRIYVHSLSGKAGITWLMPLGANELDVQLDWR
jgi:hypothetical protein